MTQGKEDATPTVFEALAAAKATIGAVRKQERNQQQGYSFRGIDAVVNAAAPALNAQGVITVPMVKKIEYGTVEVGAQRRPMAHVRVLVNYRFYGPAGDHVDALVPGESMDAGDKAVPKAMSVAYRIALLQALNLPTEDEDPDSQSYERSPREPRPARLDKEHRQGSSGYDDDPYSLPTPTRMPRGAAKRPAVPAQDEEAQEIATLVVAARSVSDLRALHGKAAAAGKLNTVVTHPDEPQKVGKLAQLIIWRRGVLEQESAALEELSQTASEFDQMEHVSEWVVKTCGVDVQEASAAQLRAAAEAIRNSR